MDESFDQKIQRLTIVRDALRAEYERRQVEDAHDIARMDNEERLERDIASLKSELRLYRRTSGTQ